MTLEQNQDKQSYEDGVNNSFKDVLEGKMNKHLNPRKIKKSMVRLLRNDGLENNSGTMN